MADLGETLLTADEQIAQRTGFNTSNVLKVLGAGLLGASGPAGIAAANRNNQVELGLRERIRERERENKQLQEQVKVKGYEKVLEMAQQDGFAAEMAKQPQDVQDNFFTGLRTAEEFFSIPAGSTGVGGGKGKDGFTLSQGQQRFDSAGNPVASVAPKSTLLTPAELAQKKEIAAAGKTEVTTILGKVPTIDQMTKLVGPKGETPDLGDTLGELKDKGFTVRSTADQKTDKQAQAAKATLDTLDKLANPVFTGDKGVENRLFNDAINTWNRIGQTDKDLALFEAFSQGTVASLVRAVGEKGSLSNKDIERGLNLIPSAGDGLLQLPDTREVAKGKLEQLRKWFDSSLGGKVGEGDKDTSELTDEELLKGF